MWPRNLTTGHILREDHNSKRSLYPSVHCSTTYNSEVMEAAQMATEDKEDVLHIRNEVLLSQEELKSAEVMSDV